MIDIQASHEHRLGCSEIAAALNLSPWKTAYQLWTEKTGREKSPNLSGHFRIQVGNDLENYVAQLYCRETGRQVRRDHTEYLHDDLPLVGNIDRRIVGEKRGLECKTSLSKWAGKDWDGAEDGIPMHYLLQTTGYLMVTGWELWDVAALLAGPELVIKTIRLDRELIALIEEGLDRFWWHVQNDTAPPITTLDDAARRWPIQEPGTELLADHDDETMVADLRDLQLTIKELEEEANAIKLGLQLRLHDRERLVDSTGRPLAAWKTQSSTRVDTAALKEAGLYEQYSKTTTSRVFRLASEKKA